MMIQAISSTLAPNISDLSIRQQQIHTRLGQLQLTLSDEVSNVAQSQLKEVFRLATELNAICIEAIDTITKKEETIRLLRMQINTLEKEVARLSYRAWVLQQALAVQCVLNNNGHEF